MIADCKDSFFNEEAWKQQNDEGQKLINGGLSYKELREMADYFERQYDDDTARNIAAKIRTRVRCAERMENMTESELNEILTHKKKDDELPHLLIW